MVAVERRDRHEIVAEILNYARGGKIKTYIMFKARLGYSQIQGYLGLLVEKGFVEKTAVKRKRQIITTYRTTKKGIEFLDRLESVDKLWKSEGLSFTK